MVKQESQKGKSGFERRKRKSDADRKGFFHFGNNMNYVGNALFDHILSSAPPKRVWELQKRCKWGLYTENLTAHLVGRYLLQSAGSGYSKEQSALMIYTIAEDYKGGKMDIYG